MSNNNPKVSTLSSVIKQGVDGKLKELHTSLPGTIESFDASTQTAKVQPAIRRIFITGDSKSKTVTPVELPQLINVPVIFPRGGGFSLTFPVVAGDECLLIFNERSIDNWHENGGVNTPSSKRFHSLSDAVCLVGLSSKPNKIPNYDPTNVQLKADNDDVSITLKADGGLAQVATVVDITAPTINLNGQVTISQGLKVDAELTVDGSTTLGATVTSDGVNISKTHVHGGSPTAALGAVTPTQVPVP